MFRAFIKRMYVYNEDVSPWNIEESNNESDPNEKDNSGSPISSENYLREEFQWLETFLPFMDPMLHLLIRNQLMCNKNI